MTDDAGFPTESVAQKKLTGTASELNNLLQIIAGTTELLENIWQSNTATDKYFTMLRTSVGRAAALTSQLIVHASGRDPKIVIHPAARSRMQDGPTRSASAAHAVQPSAKVLVVDDEPMAVELARTVLVGEGFTVMTALNGFECLSLFSADPHSFDLIILDLSMPFMDGEETFDRIRRINPDVAVLLSTGYAHPTKMERMFAQGLSGMLTKPCPPNEYVERVRSVIAGSVPDGIASA